MAKVELHHPTGDDGGSRLLIDGVDWADKVHDSVTIKVEDNVATVSLDLHTESLLLDLNAATVGVNGTLWQLCEKAGLSGTDLSTAILAWARYPTGSDGARIQSIIDAHLSKA
ncbi:hypothetical protein [Kribbella sp. CA-293567]|uniref:hypothetical protein n=1 Tax=Kribbella sp. CA-293567 TaxID=3002436 RepID=UPI0022DDE6AD|nr:hypothetical protein [Kribbella sp. CA-293567]WBQ03010.1 hypothetical protein OX958_23870 [Kribbella sp. CA-293567]